MSLHSTLWGQQANSVELAWADAGHTLVVKQWFKAGWAGSLLWHSLVSVIVWVHFTHFSHTLPVCISATPIIAITAHKFFYSIGVLCVCDLLLFHGLKALDGTWHCTVSVTTGMMLWYTSQFRRWFWQIPALNWFWCNLVCCILCILFVISYFRCDWFKLWALF